MGEVMGFATGARGRRPICATLTGGRASEGCRVPVMRISPDGSTTVRLKSLPSPFAFEYERSPFSIRRQRI